MPSLLLVVFLLQLFIHIVNTVGAPVINELLWMLYNKLPTSSSADAKAEVELRREMVRLKREQNAISPQDNFAKWAKLGRNYDKVEAQYNAKSSSTKDFRSTFDRVVMVLRWGGTNGLRFLIQFWFAKQPLFWIPRGWVPGYVEWILAFPRAPTGSVSIQMWGIACATAVQLVSTAVAAGVLLAQEQKQGGREKMAMGAGSEEMKNERKKEL